MEELTHENESLKALLAAGNSKPKKGLPEKKDKKFIKGVETMFRTTLAGHLQLSAIADNKAHLMISINAIIASIMISSFVRNFTDIPHLLIPSILLTIVCLVTTIFAVLSTRPNITSSAPQTGKTDLLFFGDYTYLSPETYRESMRETMQDPEKLYNSMIDNIYLQGKVLSKKYRLLKLSYTVFVVGLGLVLLSYALAWIFFKP